MSAMDWQRGSIVSSTRTPDMDLIQEEAAISWEMADLYREELSQASEEK